LTLVALLPAQKSGSGGASTSAGAGAVAGSGGADDRLARVMSRLQPVAALLDARGEAPASAGTVARAGRDVVAYPLAPGVRLLVRPDPTAEQVSGRAVGPGAAGDEEARLAGAAALLARLLPRATKSRSADRLAAELGEIGGTLEGSAAADSLSIGAELLAAHWE